MLLCQYEPKSEECLQHLVVSMQQGIKAVLKGNVVANLLHVHDKEAIVFLLFPAVHWFLHVSSCFNAQLLGIN